MPSNVRLDIGQLLIGSLPGTTITPEIRSMAKEFSLGGVILFARNIEAPEQVAEMSLDVQGLASNVPLWVSVDQEGGRVARLKAPFTEWPPMAVLGRSGDVQLARRFAAALAAELKAVGITLDYAPVLDIHTNPKNPIIGDRALAEDAESVGRLGAAIIAGLQENGVAACGKHFPGHGDTAVDSHLELPLVEHPPDRIRRVECVPFRQAVRAQVAFIMTAHVLVPSFDEEKPATLSPRIVQALLRDELNFQGVILSDDLEMKAIAKTYTVPEAAVEAVAAGCDGLLVCSGNIDAQAATLEALVHAVEEDRIPYKRLEDALTRLRRAKERFLTAPVTSQKIARIRQVLGCDAHRRIVDEMARYSSLGIVRKPRALKRGDRIAIVAPASPFNRDEFTRGVAEIERLGFVPAFEDSVFERHSGYLAGSPEVRAAAFMKQWRDPSVSALLAVRGGYGSVHLLPLLDRARIVERPKLFIGYSDNTSLLSWLTCQCGITALHGPMIEGRLAGGAGYDQRSFLELLSGGRRLELVPEGLTVLREGQASGPLFGGTITQLVASLGTPFAFDPPDGCVLFLEEVNERPYRIDRMLTQLALSGVLGRARALVFGEMRGCDEPGGAVTVLDAIARTTHECTGPIIVGFPSGHTTGPTWTLPLGVSVCVSTQPQPALLIEDAPVE